MIIKIPTIDGKFSQPNDGKKFGNIWATWNIDFDTNRGKIRISPQTIIRAHSDEAGKSDLSYPVAIVRSSADGTDRWWAMCGGVLYKSANSDPTSAWSKDELASSPSGLNDNCDMKDFGGSLFVTKPGTTGLPLLYRLLSGTWSDNAPPVPTLNQPAPLCVGFNNLLLEGAGNSINIRDINNNAKTGRLLFRTELKVIWIKSSSNGYWIGCRNILGEDGEIFFWDGSSNNFNYNYRIFHPECFAGIIGENDIPYVINGNGQLLKFNGGGFSEIARLPIANNKAKRWTDGETIPINVGRNGMAMIDGKVHILLSAEIDGNEYKLLENMLGGIWCYDEEIGLYHRYSITKDTGANILDYGSPILKRAGALVPTTKDKGVFLAGAGLYKADGVTTTDELRVIVSLLTADNIEKRGYIITPQIKSDQIEEAWQKIWLKFKKLLNAADQIIVKYRTLEKSFGNLDNGVTVAWSDTDTFTSTNAAFANVAVGDEIEILSGEGSGTSAHVTAISVNAGTYTVDLDTAVADASGNISVRASNWTKIGTVSDQNRVFEDFPIMTNSPWIQFKIEMRFNGDDEVDEIIANSEVSTPIN